MVKRVLFGLVWFVAIYFLACVSTGAIAGGIAGANDPDHAAEAGARAGAQAVSQLRPYLFLGSLLLSVMGSWTGFLPGTRIKRSSAPDHDLNADQSPKIQ